MSAAPDSRVVPFTNPTCEQFLRMLAGDDHWGEVLVTSFLRDPSDADGPREDWNAWPARDVINNPHFDEGNTFFCPSLLVPGTRLRHVDNFRAKFVLTFDDVGTKLELATLTSLLRTGPTYVIETSPGNCQAGWKLDPMETDLAWVKDMLHALDLKLGGKADNLTNPVAWRRLPVGWNTKAALGPKGYRVRIKVSRPDRMIRGVDDWLDIEDETGPIARMTTIGRGVGDGQRPDAAVLAADAVYQALVAGGMVIGEKITSDKFWAATILCPWIGSHGPTRPRTGAEYVPATPGHRGWFHCFHCERRTQVEFREQLDTALREAGERIVAAFEFDEVPVAAGEVEAAEDPSAELAGYAALEDEAALAFAAQHAERLRYDHAVPGWFRWVDGFWQEDRVQRVFAMARKLAREFRARQDTTPAQARAMGKIAFAAAIERAARTDDRLAVDGSAWDPNPWLVGAPGCEIDLQTGRVLPADPRHMITKQLLVAPQEMLTPLWDRFLQETTGGDAEMIRFLQAWCGYGLTGDTTEEKFVFIYGPGGNGKGTFLFTMSAILNGYAARTAAETFMVRKHEAHPTEIARLRSVRMVTAAEIEEGRTFHVARLKDFTGRDGKLLGRFMREDFFEFTPQFKVTFVGNNQPRIPSLDDAMRRRVILIPFMRKPPRADITLKDRLVAEYPGILRWMIAGENLRRKRGGLAALVPASARTATRAYLEDQDTLQAWADERCVFRPGDQVGVTQAFEDYRLWCFGRGDQTSITVQEFSRKFLEAFPTCEKIRKTIGMVLVGVSFSPQDVG